jgi:hypothetical protein
VRFHTDLQVKALAWDGGKTRQQQAAQRQAIEGDNGGTSEIATIQIEPPLTRTATTICAEKQTGCTSAKDIAY